MFRRIIIGSTLAVASWLAFAPVPAKADSFAFSYSSGDYRRYPYYGPRYGYRHYHHPPPRYYSRYYYAPPPVVYVPPPVVYAPPVYAAPPVYPAPVISAAPASPVYRAPNGQYCREYQGGVSVGGYPQSGYGTACLMPDGSWRVVN